MAFPTYGPGSIDLREVHVFDEVRVAVRPDMRASPPDVTIDIVGWLDRPDEVCPRGSSAGKPPILLMLSSSSSVHAPHPVDHSAPLSSIFVSLTHSSCLQCEVVLVPASTFDAATAAAENTADDVAAVAADDVAAKRVPIRVTRSRPSPSPAPCQRDRDRDRSGSRPRSRGHAH